MASDQDTDHTTDTRGFKRRATSLTARLFVAGSCLGWGLMLGVFFWRPARPLEPPIDPAPTESLTAATAGGPAESLLQAEPVGMRIRRAEEALRVGDAASAVQIYEELSHSSLAPFPADQLLYRMAVAQELLGDPTTAMEHYRRLVSSSSLTAIKFPARLGQARLLNVLGRPASAHRLLSEMLLSPMCAAEGKSPLAAETVYLLSDANIDLALGTARPRWLDDEGYARARPTETADRLLTLGLHQAPCPELSRMSPGVKILHRFGERPQDVQTEIRLPSLPIPVALGKIAHSAQCELQWSPQATSLSAERETRIEARNLNLAMLLDAVLAPVDLVWRARGKQIHVYHVDELSASQRQDYREAQAQRSLRHALSHFPDHDRAPFTYHALGELEFRRGNHQDAITHFRQVMRRFPDSEAQVTAAFNLGKALLINDQADEALDLFFHVVDSAPGHPLRPVANYYAGRLYLERGEADAATRPLMRCLAESTDKRTRRFSAMGLASAYLLAGNPHAANAVLMDLREEFVGSSDQNAAAFLGALARFQVGDGRNSVQEGRALVNALGQMSNDQFFGDYLYLLVGKAMRLTGLLTSMSEFYEEALTANMASWVQGEIQRELCEYYLALGQRDAARQILTPLVDNPSPKLGRWARLQLAKLNFNQQNLAECVEQCRTLLDEDLSESETESTLKLMGQAFSAQTDHFNAALCFAGMIPPPNEQEAANPQPSISPDSRNSHAD